jgi:LSD1 subclass zinc finger protein
MANGNVLTRRYGAKWLRALITIVFLNGVALLMRMSSLSPWYRIGLAIVLGGSGAAYLIWLFLACDRMTVPQRWTEESGSLVEQVGGRVRCVSCREPFKVGRGDWRWRRVECPACHTVNPNLYVHFFTLGVLILTAFLVQATYLVLQITQLGQTVDVMQMTWGIARLGLMSLAAVGIFGRERVPIYAVVSILLHAAGVLYLARWVIAEERLPSHLAAFDIAAPAVIQPSSEEIVSIPDEPLLLAEEELTIEQPPLEPEITEIPAIDVPELTPYVTDREIILRIDDSMLQPMEKPVTPDVEKIPLVYRSRFDKVAALAREGGSRKTEDSVLLALEWLKGNQNSDGSWGTGTRRTSMTALGLLCFLGHGETQLSESYGSTVRSAIEFLLEQANDEGYLADQDYRAYQHGMAVYALAEAYATTRIRAIRPVVERGLELIIDAQTEEGGWFYGYAKTRVDPATGNTEKWPGGDTSVSCWQIQALQAAWLTDIRYSRAFMDGSLDEARARAAKNLKRCFTPGGKEYFYNAGGENKKALTKAGFGYRGPDRNEWNLATNEKLNMGTTGMAVLSLQLLGEGEAPEVKTALRVMKGKDATGNYNFDMDWEKTKGSGYVLYGWYYITQAMFQASDPECWQYWNPTFTKVLTNSQKKDGSWGYPSQSHEDYGSVYSTALCCLMLEVYYRYLPTYRRISPGPATAAAE